MLLLEAEILRDGLGKNRTSFGRLLDERGITQYELELATGLSRRTISRLCNDESYKPREATRRKVAEALAEFGHKKSALPDGEFRK